MKHTGHEDVKVFHGSQRNAVGDDMHAVAARVHEARRRASARNGAPVNGMQPASVPVNGAQPVGGSSRPRRVLTSGAAADAPTNEAAGSHRLDVSPPSPATPPQVAMASPPYDFTS